MTESQNSSISTTSHPNNYLLFNSLIVNYSNKMYKYTVECEGVGRKRVKINSCRNKISKINLKKNCCNMPPSHFYLVNRIYYIT